MHVIHFLLCHQTGPLLGDIGQTRERQMRDLMGGFRALLFIFGPRNF